MKKDNSITNKLYLINILITNSLEVNEIREVIAKYGYSENKLFEGKQLYEETSNLNLEKSSFQGSKISATVQLNKLRKAAEAEYIKALEVARIVFKGSVDAYGALELGGTRKKTIDGFCSQATTFYNNIIHSPEFLSRMGAFSYTQQKLEQGLTLIDSVMQAADERDIKKGKALAATKKFSTRFKELEAWAATLKKFARIALGKDNERLESLGIPVRKLGRPRKKRDKQDTKPEETSNDHSTLPEE